MRIVSCRRVASSVSSSGGPGVDGLAPAGDPASCERDVSSVILDEGKLQTYA